MRTIIWQIAGKTTAAGCWRNISSSRKTYLTNVEYHFISFLMRQTYQKLTNENFCFTSMAKCSSGINGTIIGKRCYSLKPKREYFVEIPLCFDDWSLILNSSSELTRQPEKTAHRLMQDDVNDDDVNGDDDQSWMMTLTISDCGQTRLRCRHGASQPLQCHLQVCTPGSSSSSSPTSPTPLPPSSSSSSSSPTPPWWWWWW